MNPGVWFPAFLIATLALLGAVVATGKRALRRRHLILVEFTVVSLGFTIYYAEKLGEFYDLEAAGSIYPFHITVAKITVGLFLLPVATGIATLRNARVRRLHGRIAWVVLAMTLLTGVTGAAMLWAAEPLAAG